MRGYSSGAGAYGFRAYFTGQALPAPGEYEDDDSFSTAKDIEIGTLQRHTFTTGNDVDWVKFEAGQAGRYTITVQGPSAQSGA